MENWKKQQSRKVYEGIIVDIERTVFTQEDAAFDAEIIVHPGGAVIAASPDGENFLMVKQFRFAANETMLEFPAGKLEPGEDPASVALRELEEETGYRAHSLVSLGHVYSSPAIFTECIHLYYAHDLEFVGQNLDEGEELEVSTLNFQELEAMALNNSITDGKSVALIFKLKHYLERKRLGVQP